MSAIFVFMKNKLRIGILDFYNIQNAERTNIHFGREKGNFLKNTQKGSFLLSKAVRELGHQPVLYLPEFCQLGYEQGKSEIRYKGKPLKGCDVLIPRINVVRKIDQEISIIKEFELLGIPLVNRYQPILNAMNKLRTLQLLTKNKIPVPKTIVVRSFEFLDKAIEMVGGYPVILKSIFGTHGKGVAIIESRRSLLSALDIIWKFNEGNLILIQEYVAESLGEDYRAFVIGEKVVASMKRSAPVGDFRSNLMLGGNAEAVELTEEEKKIAIQASKALGLETCGVDILRSKNGPVIMEMNACAGLSGITKSSSVDVAKKLIEYAITLVS